MPVLFIAATTLSSSGCLTALGLNRSSLSPRTAATPQQHSTFRSQDERLSQAAPGLQPPAPANSTTTPVTHTVPAATEASGAGYAEFGSADRFVRARLLTPDFGSAQSPNAAAAVSNSPAAVPAFNAETSAKGPANPPIQPASAAQPGSAAQPDSQARNGLPFSANQLREYMNNQSRNAMSEGQVLPEQPPQWRVLSATGLTPQESVDQPAASGAQASPDVPDSTPAAEEKSTVAVSSSTPESAANADAAPPPAGEPTMLDRLKGFYEPAADVTSRSMWRRQFQRLQSPFNVFRERPETLPAEGQSTPIQQSVRAAAEIPATTAAVPPSNSGASTPELLDQLIASLVHELQTWPRQANGSPEDLSKYLRRQQDLRLLYLIAQQPGSAIQAVEDLPPGEQDFWQELMLALARYRADDTDTSDEQRLTNTAGQVRSAARHLQSLSALSLRRLEICSRIHSFGRIEPFPSNDFDPGQPILLYAEVENFATKVTSTGTWRTRFDAQLQILEEGNDRPKETIDLTSITDEATSERHDYYQSFELNLPSHLKSGPYFVRLRLRDRISGKVCESQIGFQVR